MHIVAHVRCGVYPDVMNGADVIAGPGLPIADQVRSHPAERVSSDVMIGADVMNDGVRPIADRVRSHPF